MSILAGHDISTLCGNECITCSKLRYRAHDPKNHSSVFIYCVYDSLKDIFA